MFEDVEIGYMPDDAEKDASDAAFSEFQKKAIRTNNKMIVAELKSTVRTIVIALDRPIHSDEIQDAVEFFMETSVDLRLINQALRQLVKENRLEKNENGSYQLPATRKHMYDALAAYKSQNRPIGR